MGLDEHAVDLFQIDGAGLVADRLNEGAQVLPYNERSAGRGEQGIKRGAGQGTQSLRDKFGIQLGAGFCRMGVFVGEHEFDFCVAEGVVVIGDEIVQGDEAHVFLRGDLPRPATVALA